MVDCWSCSEYTALRNWLGHNVGHFQHGVIVKQTFLFVTFNWYQFSHTCTLYVNTLIANKDKFFPLTTSDSLWCDLFHFMFILECLGLSLSLSLEGLGLGFEVAKPLLQHCLLAPNCFNQHLCIMCNFLLGTSTCWPPYEFTFPVNKLFLMSTVKTLKKFYKQHHCIKHEFGKHHSLILTT